MGKQKNRGQNMDDLAHLGSPSEDSITATLKVRFESDTIYTRINDGTVVALNPFKDLHPVHPSEAYVSEYKDISAENVDRLPPHVYQLANQAYLHMRRTGVDQSIILSGESGSGKTATFDLILQHLIALSGHKKEAKLLSQIQGAQVVLEALGNAKTQAHDNASRFGKYIELQFNERGRMTGAKTLNYQLEKSRTAHCPYNEHNFHVFYYLLAGTTAEEKSILHLSEGAQYAYLKRTTPDSDATERFENFKSGLRAVGISKRHQARIMQLLAALLHLGNLQFVDGNNMQEAAAVKNTELLDLVADFLGLDVAALEGTLTYKTQTVKKDTITMILTAEQASERRDELVTTLYSLLFTWIVEQINAKLCHSTTHNFIGILDMPGPHISTATGTFHDFCVNYANERIHSYTLRYLFEIDVEDYRANGLDIPDVPYFSNAACVELLEKPKQGLIDLANRSSKSTERGTDMHMYDAFCKYNGGHDSFAVKKADTGTGLFAIQHFSGQVAYNPNGFVEQNKNVLSPDFVTLFRGGDDAPESYNAFVLGLFGNAAIATESHPKDAEAIMNAQLTDAPARSPSMRRTRSKRRNQNQNVTEETKEEEASDRKVSMVLSQLQQSLNSLITTLEETTPWFVFCLRPNEANVPNTFDSNRVRAQIRALGLAQMAERAKHAYTISFFIEEFCERYGDILRAVGVDQERSPRAQCEAAAAIFGWLGSAAAIGEHRIFLNEMSWRNLEDQLRAAEKQGQQGALKEDNEVPGLDHASNANLSGTAGQDRFAMAAAAAAAAGLPAPRGVDTDFDQRSFASDDVGQYRNFPDAASQAGSDGFASSASGFMEMKTMLAPATFVQVPNENETVSGTRKRWLAFVWFMTWWIPSKLLETCGRMKRPDVRTAWREKMALCMMIFLIAAFIIWFLVGFGRIVCPKQDVYSPAELQAHSSRDNAHVAIRGEVFDLSSFAPRHYGVVPTSGILSYAGTDASDLLPVQVNDLCLGVSGKVSPFVPLDYHFDLIDSTAEYHDFRAWTGLYRPNWYYDQLSMLRKNYKLGDMAHTPKDLREQANNAVNIGGRLTKRTWAILDGAVYDLTYYVLGDRTPRYGKGQAIPANITADGEVDYMSPLVVELFEQKAGQDITKDWNALDLEPDVKDRQKVCLRNLFYAGKVDQRSSARCVFAEYLLLIVTVLLCLVIVFKFLAALQFSSTGPLEEHDKFVICQVPCYTEDEDSLRKTIDSISTLKYDDKRKLLFLICDGMIVGGGNDRPTPRIVLDILGADPNQDPEPLSFLSIGEGSKQHNMGKVYSGLYEVRGHVVPYIVVVKVGKPTERQKPGNRGKRDSQLILMRFLNKIHFNAPMTPLELEMYHQIKNVIGVNPSFYEFILMVDADTAVRPDGLSRLMSHLVRDSRIIGLCGETMLSNAKDTWVTMIQVYEYFISHYLIKAFESLFGSVTCLPGCFSIYRIRSATKNQPLLISNQVISDYEINKVDTLHKKNLLYLGEDRYLTTLILKHFPNYQTRFTPDAVCETNAPDRWPVLLSQRRRWINSTVHNLGELVYLPQLCGICCFSMRFIVMIDLLSTVAQPAVVGYIVYLIYSLATSQSGVPIMSIITIAGVYGLQAIIFILHRKWEHIIWMLISIFAIPVFSFAIPIYAYWHFDDFSWGTTRVVLGEKGRKKIVGDEGTFDPKTIPTMTWAQYEESLFVEQDDWQDDNASFVSRGTARSGHSQASLVSHQSRGTHSAKPKNNPSYGGSRSMMGASFVPSQYGYPTSNPSMTGMMGGGTPSFMGPPMGQFLQQPSMMSFPGSHDMAHGHASFMAPMFSQAGQRQTFLTPSAGNASFMGPSPPSSQMNHPQQPYQPYPPSHH